MKLTYNKDYKSIKSFNDIELPTFTVLIGANGSGKSQLLESMFIGSALLVEDNKILINNMDYNESNKVVISNIFNNNIINIQEIKRNDGIELLTHINIFENLITRYDSSMFHNNYVKPFTTTGDFNLQTNIQNVQNNNRFKRIFIELRNKFGRDLSVVTQNDYKDFLALNPELLSDKNMFNQNFTNIILVYAQKLKTNELKELRKFKGKEDSFLSDDEFEDKYGPKPWDEINRLLRDLSLEYYVKEPDTYDDIISYNFELFDKNDSVIQIKDLSTGEKILLSLLSAIYTSKDSDTKVSFPKVILLDEVDSHLHPKMVKEYIKLIKEVIVDKLGIKVIISTHNPTTVAMCPEESIHEVHKFGDKKVIKISKEESIKKLLYGVDAISLNYENIIQVFVESGYDVMLYTTLKRILFDRINPEVLLNFIAFGINSKEPRNSNCVQVKRLVNDLTSNGNKKVRGIIDFDNKEKSTKFIKVLGENKRYSIENYILDPLMIGILLILEAKKTPEYFDLPTGFNLQSSLTRENIQIIVDKVESDVLSKLKENDEYEDEKNECTTIDDTKYKVSKKILFNQGHELETAVIETYDTLKSYREQDKGLKGAIINKVFRQYRNLISIDLLELLQELQNN